MFSLVSKIKRSKINFTKIYQADLKSPRRELSNGGLGIVVALLVRQGIALLCVLGVHNLAVLLFIFRRCNSGVWFDRNTPINPLGCGDTNNLLVWVEVLKRAARI